MINKLVGELGFFVFLNDPISFTLCFLKTEMQRENKSFTAQQERYGSNITAQNGGRCDNDNRHQKY